MDDVDQKLVALLRENARLPIASLAQALGLARGTVQSRIDRMIERGVIQGFTIRLAPESEPERIRAVTMIEVEGERSGGVIKALRGIPEVRAIHSTNGRWDLVVELNTGSLEAFDQALQRIRLVRGIANTETSLLLASYKF